MSRRVNLLLMHYATMQQRLAGLRRLETTAPGLCRMYFMSCWAYSVTGLCLVLCQDAMPPLCRSTGLTSLRTYGLMLMLQGPVSYANDAVATFGYPVPGGNQQLIVYLDRAVAWANVVNMVGAVLTFPNHGGEHAGLRLVVGIMLLAVCAVAYPTSKSYEISGQMRGFLAWHSVWHYVPNALALIWVSLWL